MLNKERKFRILISIFFILNCYTFINCLKADTGDNYRVDDGPLTFRSHSKISKFTVSRSDLYFHPQTRFKMS